MKSLLKKNWNWLIVGGAPRSGTTFLALILNSHPQIQLTINSNLPKVLKDLHRVFYTENFAQRRDMNRELSVRENHQFSDFVNLIPQFKKVAPKMLEILIEVTVAEQLNIADARYLGDKSNRYFTSDFDTFVETCGPVYIIHISRNPFDAVSSMLWRTSNAQRGLDYWDPSFDLTRACAEWIRAWNFVYTARHREGVKILHLKYEDIIRDTATQFKNISEFLQIENSFDTKIIAQEQFQHVESRRTAREKVSRLIPYISESWDLPLEKLEDKFPRLEFDKNPLRRTLIQLLVGKGRKYIHQLLVNKRL